MKTLIDENSPKYKRRLVREVKKVLVNGSVYAVTHSFAQICSFRKITAISYNASVNQFIVTYTDGIKSWGDKVFKDGNGQIICALKE